MTEPDIKPKPKANIRFLYTFCNDVKLIRAFYTDLLGMTEASFMDTEDFGWLAYQCEGLQYMFFRADSELPHEHRWAEQPGESVERRVHCCGSVRGANRLVHFQQHSTPIAG